MTVGAGGRDDCTEDVGGGQELGRAEWARYPAARTSPTTQETPGGVEQNAEWTAQPGGTS